MPLQKRPRRASAEGLTTMSLRLNPEQRGRLEWLVETLNYNNMTEVLIALIDQEYENQQTGA